MTDLLPNGPFGWTLTTLFGAACIMAILSSERRELWFIVVMMCANWLFVQAASDLGNVGLAAVGAACSGIMLVLWGTEIAFAISVLYIPRLLAYAANHFLGLPVFWMWEVSNVFFILQVAILTGGSMHGTRILLAWLFDFVGRMGAKRHATQGFWADILGAIKPKHKIDRSSFQKG